MSQQKPNVLLTQQRTLRGWSQKKVAASIGSSEKRVSAWECGDSRPSPLYQDRLCRLFKTTSERLGFSKVVATPLSEITTPSKSEIAFNLSEQEELEIFSDPEVEIEIETCSVYALCDPRTGDIRYIGQAIDIYRRYAHHLLNKADGPKRAWMAELQQEQKLPTLILLETKIPKAKILDRESYWILHYIQQGYDLTNLAIPGRSFTPRQGKEVRPEYKYTIAEIAHIFCVDESVIGGYIMTGDLIASKEFAGEGKDFQWIISESDIDKFIAKQRIKAR